MKAPRRIFWKCCRRPARRSGTAWLACSGEMPMPSSSTSMRSTQRPPSGRRRTRRAMQPSSGSEFARVAQRVGDDLRKTLAVGHQCLGNTLVHRDEKPRGLFLEPEIDDVLYLLDHVGEIEVVSKSSSLPASILDMSSTSLITPRRWVEASRILARQYSFFLDRPTWRRCRPCR